MDRRRLTRGPVLPMTTPGCVVSPARLMCTPTLSQPVDSIKRGSRPRSQQERICSKNRGTPLEPRENQPQHRERT